MGASWLDWMVEVTPEVSLNVDSVKLKDQKLEKDPRASRLHEPDICNLKSLLEKITLFERRETSEDPPKTKYAIRRRAVALKLPQRLTVDSENLPYDLSRQRLPGG
jgi:hypothetical protein